MIVRATINDLDAMVLLDKQIFPLEPFGRNLWRYALKSKHQRVYLVKEHDAFIGAGSVWITPLKNGKTKGRIYTLGIIQAQRKKGYGGLLLATMIYDLIKEKVSYITLETHAKDIEYIELYKKHGFVKTEDLPEYYEDGDGIRMRKTI
jgi:ribosomal protein S18 acetylase RimI-like enzyme